jgi:ribonuclease E
MNPDEQEVYAWMGISPLILATEEVKNPRSALISVVLPGEAPPKELPPDETPASTVATPATLVLKAKNPEPQDEIEPDSTEVEVHSPSPKDSIANVLVIDEPLTDVSPADDPAESEENAVNRRRRRRSSATISD